MGIYTNMRRAQLRRAAGIREKGPLEMPPVESFADTTKTKKVKFLRNTACEGTDYYIGDVADADIRWATTWLATGRVEEVKGEVKGEESSEAKKNK